MKESRWLLNEMAADFFESQNETEWVKGTIYV
jgi:hypothetical protein